VNKGDRRGAAPLHYCAAKDNVVVARELLVKGADPAIRDLETECTALHVAAHSGHNDVMRVLVEGGADVNAVDGANDETPLFDAAKEGWTDTCQVLLAMGADPCHRNNLAYQPYFVAQEWNFWETGEVLIEAMGDRYEKLRPFTFPRAPRAARRPRSAGDQPTDGAEDDADDEEDQEVEQGWGRRAHVKEDRHGAGRA